MWRQFRNLPIFAAGLFLAISQPCQAEEAKETAPVETSVDQDRVETEPMSQAEIKSATRAYAKEKEFRRSEQAFVNLDHNGNFVIDAEEWASYFEEKRGLIPKAEWEQVPGKMKEMDADKDGALSDAEVDKWLRTRFEERIKRYVKSEIYKSQKAEFDKQQAGKTQ